MKYICTKTQRGKEEIFTFPNSINHDYMAEQLAGIKAGVDSDWERILRIPVSAGFVWKNGTCFGDSHTLGISSRGEADTLLLAEQYL